MLKLHTMCRPVRGRRSSSERLSWMSLLLTGQPGCVARKTSNFAEACVEIFLGVLARLLRQFLNLIGKFYSGMDMLLLLWLDFDCVDLEYYAFIDYMDRFEKVVTFFAMCLQSSSAIFVELMGLVFIH